ncbi:MAG TPA: zf-HC2 domain-containing protein, partial [Polyangiales bacterium]|nr:zf-HC2 domain-containing protein [Polyangiales bacterium]
MRLACLEVGQLLERRNAGLSAAEGLRLEEHLATCAGCRADANLLTGLSEVAAAARVELSAAARERAIAHALSGNARPHAPRAVPPRRVAMMLLGAAAALVIGFVSMQQSSREDERVLSGEVQVAG